MKATGGVATVQVKFDGEVYERQQGRGPLAAEFTEPWHKFDPEVI